MTPLELAMQAAVATPYGTAAQELASQICLMRGIDPNEFTEGLPNWKFVVAEEMIRAALRREIAV